MFDLVVHRNTRVFNAVSIILSPTFDPTSRASLCVCTSTFFPSRSPFGTKYETVRACTFAYLFPVVFLSVTTLLCIMSSLGCVTHGRECWMIISLSGSLCRLKVVCSATQLECESRVPPLQGFSRHWAICLSRKPCSSPPVGVLTGIRRDHTFVCLVCECPGSVHWAVSRIFLHVDLSVLGKTALWSSSVLHPVPRCSLILCIILSPTRELKTQSIVFSAPFNFLCITVALRQPRNL